MGKKCVVVFDISFTGTSIKDPTVIQVFEKPSQQVYKLFFVGGVVGAGKLGT